MKKIFILVALMVSLIVALQFDSETRLKTVKSFGILKLGGPAPFDQKPGDDIQHGYLVIPPSRFYVYLYEMNHDFDYGCTFDQCGINGALVSPMKGWLYGDLIHEEEMFGVPTSINLNAFIHENKPGGGFITGEKSIVIVADQQSRIVGLYPDSSIEDLRDILMLHPDLADFDSLEGISELSPIKVGGHLSLSFSEVKDIFMDEEPEKFSMYMIGNEQTLESSCAYECGYYYERISDLGGKIYEIHPEQYDTVRKFGLDPSQVKRGEVSLIVLTDKNLKIVAIHPNKILRDSIAIIHQYPELFF